MQITSTYEHELQVILNQIARRGLLCRLDKLEELHLDIDKEVDALAERISNIVNLDVGIGQKHQVNLRSTVHVKNLLLRQGLKIPKVRPTKAQRVLGETESKESTGALALRKLFSESGNEVVKNILRIRELETMRSRYVNALYMDGIFFSSYDAAGTDTGRRGSKKNIFGWGGNGQNLPKHSALAKKYRKCFIPRPGNIFLSVDQISAEDWPTSVLASNTHALDELRQGIDRHRKLASYIFGKPPDLISEYPERFLGKKGRHASNYGMGAATFSDALVKEGNFLSIAACEIILQKVHQYDPNIRGVYHKYIQEEILKSRILRTPLGRERYFLGFRPGDNNAQKFCEAYAYIPQSVVGDNTGLAIVALGVKEYIIADGHDALLLEVPDSLEEIEKALARVTKAFDRTIKFHNGIEINIPIEAEIGYSLGDMKKIKKGTTLAEVYEELQSCKGEILSHG